MANLEVEPTWLPVRQLETHELARGGLNGNMNDQAKSLLARTEYLNNEKASKSEIVQGVFEFTTYSEFNSEKAILPLNCTVVIGEENTTGSGSWGVGNNRWNGTTLSKSEHDPLIKSKVYTDSEFNKIAYLDTKNKYDPSKSVSGYRVNGTGVIAAVTGAMHTGHIAVQSDKQYTMSWSNSVTSESAYYAFYEKEGDTTNPISYSISGATTSPQTFTAPTGANFIVVTLKHGSSTTERLKFQLEEGNQATIYEPYNLVVKPQPSILEDAVKKNELAILVQPLTEKPYEFTVISKNLFNHTDLLVNKFLSTADGSINTSSGWICSGFIPVVAGKTYTLSGTRARQGISFFQSNVITIDAALLYDNTIALPLTVTAPTGANFAVIALESASAKGYSNIQFEEGSTATPYMPYGLKDQLLDGKKVDSISLKQISDLEDLQIKPASTLRLLNGNGSVKNENIEIALNVFNSVNHESSSVFNFVQDKYKNTVVRINGDDSAPVRMMGATIGANHGYAKTVLTINSHGKTDADIGSVWSDDSKEWVIIQIISVNSLAVTCRTENRSYSSTLPKLTHVSGAQNSASVTPTSKSDKQWYSMLKNHKVNLMLDNQVHNGLNLERGFNDSLKISESYDLMEKADIVEWLILNGSKEVTNYSAASACNVSHTHTFNSDLTDVISANFFVYKNLSAALDLMFTQSARMQAVNNEVHYYVPRSIPFAHESVNYDFSKPTNVANLIINNRIDFTVELTEEGGVIPDRLIMLAGELGYATGYLPALDAAPDVRNSRTNKGIQISNSEAKVYLYLVDGLTTLPAGANYACFAYRTYFKRPTDTRRTVQYDIQNGKDAYLYLDWHEGNFEDIVGLKPYLQGRSFEVIEKTDNVTLLCKVASENIAVKISNVTSNASLILKF